MPTSDPPSLLAVIGIVVLFLALAVGLLFIVAVLALPAAARENDQDALTTGRLPAPKAPGAHSRRIG